MAETYEQKSLRHQKRIDGFILKFVAHTEDLFFAGMYAIGFAPVQSDNVIMLDRKT